jgi:hypothetical protein
VSVLLGQDSTQWGTKWACRNEIRGAVETGDKVVLMMLKRGEFVQQCDRRNDRVASRPAEREGKTERVGERSLE